MIHRQRPNSPPSYSDYNINKIRKNQEKIINQWLKSTQKHTRSRLTRELLSLTVRHQDVPGFRPELNQCFDHKCPFCETKLDAAKTKVFFYRPPSDVPQGPNENDKPDECYYRWLMWEWSNLFPACEDCHTNKGLKFPVANQRANLGIRRKSILKNEGPFLLDPCEDYPDDHLEFHEDGSVTAKLGSERGEKTIEILSLNRVGLQARRKEEALALKQAWEEKLRGASDSLKEVGEIFQIVYQENCRDDQQFAGMKRQLLGLWSEGVGKKGIESWSLGKPQVDELKNPIESKVDVQKSDKRPLRIFLCHSSVDKPRVRELYGLLVTDGFDVWFDEEKLVPGQDWDLEIRKAVRSSDTVIVCLSNGSITKEGYVQKEIRLALDIADEKPEGTIFLIPVRLDECDVPDRLSKWHWVNFFEELGYEKLLRALRTHAEKKGLLWRRNDSAADTEI